MGGFRKYKFLLLRRTTQIGTMLLFIGGSMFGWQVLRGNLSTSKVFDAVTLTDPYAILQIISAGRIVAPEALIGGLIVMLFFGLLAGRAFCSWICPLNMVTDAANWLRTKTGIDARSKGLEMSRRVRYWAIGVSLAVSFFSGIAAFEWISPISMLHRGIIFGMGMGWVMVLSVFLFDLFMVKHGFCGHVCPLGGFYSLITNFSLIRVNYSLERCTLCMKCLDICPERQVLPMIGKLSRPVTSGECTNCARCIEVCDDRALKFGMRFVPGKH